MQKFTFFWHGPFSQWHPCLFELYGQVYNCAEQWMMATKARIFNDDESLKQIMKSNNPKEQKALGRKVKNFDLNKWNEKARSVVHEGNLAKFGQNKELKELLLATEGELVEASPYDTVWGVGLAEDNPLILDKKNWKGTNWLGEVLTQLREEFKFKIEWKKINKIHDKEIQFIIFMDNWMKETKYLSSTNAICENENFQKIVNLGEDILHKVYKAFSYAPIHMACVAEKITNQNITISEEDLGDVEKISKAWKEIIEKNPEIKQRLL